MWKWSCYIKLDISVVFIRTSFYSTNIYTFLAGFKKKKGWKLTFWMSYFLKPSSGIAGDINVNSNRKAISPLQGLFMMKGTLKIFWCNLSFYRWDPQRRNDLWDVLQGIGRASSELQLSAVPPLLTKRVSAASQRKIISAHHILRLFWSTWMYASIGSYPQENIWH